MKKTDLNIINIQGQIIKKINNTRGDQLVIDRDNLPAGIYLLQLIQDSEIISTRKLVMMD